MKLLFVKSSTTNGHYLTTPRLLFILKTVIILYYLTHKTIQTWWKISRLTILMNAIWHALKMGFDQSALSVYMRRTRINIFPLMFTFPRTNPAAYWPENFHSQKTNLSNDNKYCSINKLPLHVNLHFHRHCATVTTTANAILCL